MIVLTLNHSQNITNIQDQFTLVFPYLKLELVKPKQNSASNTSKKHIFEKDISKREFPKKYSKDYIHITEEMPISVLEKLFLEHFELTVTILRKSGKTWLETSQTADWTLKHQNEEGEALSIFVKGKNPS